jgi:hypothetical protein
MQYTLSVLFALLCCRCSFSSELVWQRDLQTRLISPPVVWEGKVFVASENGQMTAFNTDGSKAWEQLLGTSISGHPVITKRGEILVVVAGQKLVILNLLGQKLSESAIDDCPFGPSAFFDGQGLLPYRFRPPLPGQSAWGDQADQKNAIQLHQSSHYPPGWKYGWGYRQRDSC